MVGLKHFCKSYKAGEMEGLEFLITNMYFTIFDRKVYLFLIGPGGVMLGSGLLSIESCHPQGYFYFLLHFCILCVGLFF